MKYALIGAAVVAASLGAGSASATSLSLPPGNSVMYGSLYDPTTDTTFVAVTKLDRLTPLQDAYDGINAITAGGGPVGWLADIRSEAENTFLVDGYKARGLDLWGYRMGATRDPIFTEISPGEWKITGWSGPWIWNWSPSDPIQYANWGPGQPDTHDGNEFLGIFWDNGTWNDTNSFSGLDSTTGTHYHLGYVLEFQGNIGPVPEPAICALMLVGLAGVAAATDRRRR